LLKKELAKTRAFQYLAVLLNDKATGIRENKREFGQIIVVSVHQQRGRKDGNADENYPGKNFFGSANGSHPSRASTVAFMTLPRSLRQPSSISDP